MKMKIVCRHKLRSQFIISNVVLFFSSRIFFCSKKLDVNTVNIYLEVCRWFLQQSCKLSCLSLFARCKVNIFFLSKINRYIVSSLWLFFLSDCRAQDFVQLFHFVFCDRTTLNIICRVCSALMSLHEWKAGNEMQQRQLRAMNVSASSCVESRLICGGKLWKEMTEVV